MKSRPDRPRPSFILILAVLFFILLEMLAPDRNEEDSSPQAGGTLLLAFSMPILSLDPYSFGYGAQNELFPFIYSFLLTPRPDGGFDPDLAMRWWSENDELDWHFVLRPEARFHDGRPVLAQDAAYSVEQMLKLNPVLAENVESIESSQPRRLHIRLKRRVPDFLYKISIESVVPRPRPDDPELDRQPIGSGPYLVAARDKDRRLLLKRWDGYYGRQPYIPEVSVMYEPNEETIWLQYMQGDIHFCLNSSPENVYYMRIEPSHYLLEGRLSSGATILLFNNRHSFFSDRSVRRALAQVLNIEGHIRRDIKGLAEACPGPLGRMSPFLPPDSGPSLPDWKSAAQTLAQAGWEDHDADMYRDRDGQDFEFDLLVPDNYQTELATAEYIQRAFNQFGIKANLVRKRYDEMVQSDLKPGAFAACLNTQNTNPRALGVLYLWWSSGPGGLGNYGGYKNEKVDQALEEMLRVDREKDYAGPLAVVHQQVLKDQPAVWFYHLYQVYAFSPRLKGVVRPNPEFYLTRPLLDTWIGPRPRWWPRSLRTGEVLP
ncbi:MAG: ABC transporter substrate-binding protein [Thermodesulfobacteriota bacterium]